MLLSKNDSYLQKASRQMAVYKSILIAELEVHGKYMVILMQQRQIGTPGHY